MLNNWLGCSWVQVIGKVWECKTCGECATKEPGLSFPTCNRGEAE